MLASFLCSLALKPSGTGLESSNSDFRPGRLSNAIVQDFFTSNGIDLSSTKPTVVRNAHRKPSRCAKARLALGWIVSDSISSINVLSMKSIMIKSSTSSRRLRLNVYVTKSSSCILSVKLFV